MGWFASFKILARLLCWSPFHDVDVYNLMFFGTTGRRRVKIFTPVFANYAMNAIFTVVV
jgi:hypothetical protein